MRLIHRSGQVHLHQNGERHLTGSGQRERREMASAAFLPCCPEYVHLNRVVALRGVAMKQKGPADVVLTDAWCACGA